MELLLHGQIKRINSTLDSLGDLDKPPLSQEEEKKEEGDESGAKEKTEIDVVSRVKAHKNVQVQMEKDLDELG